MNKLSLKIIFLCILISGCLQAQEPAPVLMNVYYEFIHVNDTNNRDKPLVETMLLQLSETNSRYRRAPLKRTVQVSPKAETGGPMRVVSGKPMAVVNGPGITEETLIQLPKEGKLNTTASLGIQDYIMETSLPKIDWKISEETRKIGGYTCQKAAGAYAGRTYTAWFTSDLPFQDGPWKLSGLPGLILEAEDAKKEVRFLFKEASKDSNELRFPPSRRKPVQVSEQAFARAKEAFSENPAAVMQAQLPPGAPTVEIAYRDASGNTTLGEAANPLIEKKKKEVKAGNNNPLELTRK